MLTPGWGECKPIVKRGCPNLRIFSAALGVSLRPLRLSCHLTQRTLRYAEDAEKSSVYAVAVAIKYKVPATGAFELISHFMTFWFVSSLSTHEP